ncbi:MAG: 16S rRNA (cytidine(1402)-2'-O)-methyltransferase [Candidatus Omnitrophota bacterium]|nr:16S rRNA (cytidine(1402)-2'-O)-methyltransferase [Candidatus Omnitrophota bacterium]MBU1894434.1 16S rRNA (cytidine(1402)-2'-O)-methyltransferase [Candidatus Omnitrophota bacterium]
MKNGTLYIVSTPIGNLEDITLRAIRILKEADIVAAEDTRKTSILFTTYDIKSVLTSYHSYNAKQKTEKLVKLLKEGKNIALVSDSGTPGISDPGVMIINACIDNDIVITTVPGPTAFIPALVLSGKPTHKFMFEGFLSNKTARRRKQLEEFKNETRTVIIYESPHRIVKFLKDFIDVLGDKEIILARELTKKFEEVRREKASLQLEHFSQKKPRGEFIVVF